MMTKPINFLCMSFACLFSATVSSQNVNPFTGSLDYGAPLLSVPTDRGDAVPIVLMYGGNGINVEQPATEVGLGWSLAAGGSIVRSVSGIPDDYNVRILNQDRKLFNIEKGCLYGLSGADMLSTRRNLDSNKFYFPNYDTYNVSGPGIGGSITPMMLNYMAFMDDGFGSFRYDIGESGPWVKPQFVFNGDFSDTLVSRHFPDPTYSGTPFKMPKDVISGACYGDATSYYGKKGNGTGPNCSENYDPVTNRLATPNYIEYDIDPAGIDGITGFKITNSAGFVYYYGLPVYTNYSVNYSYPLRNDYTMPDYTNTFSPTTRVYGPLSSAQYYVEQVIPGSATSYITETNSPRRIAKEWKLTAVTGPDYVDANNNFLIDDHDKGYWVIYHYELWTPDMTTRYPAYGFNYSYGSEGKTENYALTDANKIGGKFGVASVVNEEVYYLNGITTPTHKAIFVRDLRQDEAGANPGYDSGLQDKYKINTPGVINSQHGNIYDEGGTSTYPTNPPTGYTRTVRLGKVSDLRLSIKELSMGTDELFIYAGDASSTTLIGSSPYSNLPSSASIDIVLNNYPDTAITFKIVKHGSPSSWTYVNGFNVEWHATGKRTPQLYLKRILLMRSDSAYSAHFPSSTLATSLNPKFDLSNTTHYLYHEGWYQANKTYLDASTLKGVELAFDYSLANKYHRNINCDDYFKNTRLSSPAQVLQSLVVNPVTGGTGKLTLKKIISTEMGGVQVLPTRKFDYNDNIATDNPDYNPVKVDNWGFYKHNASTLGYYGYVTATSKDYTDAWSLRKITAPYGGVTEIEYEPNSYNKVSDGNGGYRPAERIFPIASLTGNSTVLQINLEEGTNLNEDLSDVYNAFSTATADVFIPFNKNPTVGGGATGIDLVNYFGSLSYNYNPGTPLPINVSHIGKESNMTTTPNVLFNTCSNIASGAFTGANPAEFWGYTGNGWVRFQMPGSLVYGGGNRVRKIISHNGATDAYVTLYEYQDGVALNEADRFTSPKYRMQSSLSCSMPGKLQAYGVDRYEPRSAIGYKKVKIKNLGQIDSEKGWTEMKFRTSGTMDDDAPLILSGNVDNFAVSFSEKTGFAYAPAEAPSCIRRDTGYVIEYTDRFSPFWGLMDEQKQFDVNGNMITRTVNEYESTEQGAIVENFTFLIKSVGDPGGAPCGMLAHGPSNIYQTCIKRLYPAALKRSIEYGIESRVITQILQRDEITGEENVVRISGNNLSTSLSVKIPAFRIPSYSTMGPKSVNSAWSNIMGAKAYSYSSLDTNLTNTIGQPAVNFGSAVSNVFTKNALVREYDSFTHLYANTASTIAGWYNSSSYRWAGSQGSLDVYGLYKRPELIANPFDFSSPTTNSAKWRLQGETSLMDGKNHILESRTYDSKFSATKFDYYSKYPISQIKNCNYKSFTYTGFENDNLAGTTDGEIALPSGCTIFKGITPHTGKACAWVTVEHGPGYSVGYEGAGPNGEDLGLMRGRIYRASAWVFTEGAPSARLTININGQSGGVYYDKTETMFVNDPKAVVIGAWQLLYVDVKVPEDYERAEKGTDLLSAWVGTGEGNAYFDDFQLHPVETTVNSNVYDYRTGRVVAEVDAEGYATKYTYDAAGNVVDVYKEIPNSGLKLIKHKTFNYARGTN